MEWFKKFFAPAPAPARVRLPLTPEVAARVSEGMLFARSWVCTGPGGGKPCLGRVVADGTAHPATLRIRAREDHPDGPSNFFPYPVRHKLAGHSRLPPGELTWHGLAEERGWKTDPVMCPACRSGLSVHDYKAARR